LGGREERSYFLKQRERLEGNGRHSDKKRVKDLRRCQGGGNERKKEREKERERDKQRLSERERERER